MYGLKLFIGKFSISQHDNILSIFSWPSLITNGTRQCMFFAETELALNGPNYIFGDSALYYVIYTVCRIGKAICSQFPWKKIGDFGRNPENNHVLPKTQMGRIW